MEQGANTFCKYLFALLALINVYVNGKLSSRILVTTKPMPGLLLAFDVSKFCRWFAPQRIPSSKLDLAAASQCFKEEEVIEEMIVGCYDVHIVNALRSVLESVDRV